MITIYTDGACLNNQEKENKGGWAYYILYPEEGEVDHNCGKEINTTNQRMEMTACIKAIETIIDKEDDVILYTDSAYVINCIKEKWYLKWYQNGWINAKGQPVKNQDLWRELLHLMGQKYIKFEHVKGHSGNKFNDLVDKIARNAANSAAKAAIEEVS